MARSNFSDLVTDWVRKSKLRMNEVYRQSAQETIKEAQTPTAKGGNMRVRTGFLINSGIAELNTIPSGQSVAPEGYQAAGWNPQPMILVINKATLEDRIIFGWTANYAEAREAKDGFLRLSAQNWPQTVKRVSKQAEKRMKK